MTHSYATVAEFIAVRGEREAITLSNLDDPGATEVEEAVILEALENASSEIDGHLSVRYSTPVTPTPNLLRKFAIVIARKDLDRYQRAEYIQKDYEDVIASLKRMAKGMESLMDSNGNPILPDEDVQEVALGTVSSGHTAQTFTRDSLSHYGRLSRGY